MNRENEVQSGRCLCGLNLYAVMTDGKKYEYIQLGVGCTDRLRRAAARGWYKANRCEACGTLYTVDLQRIEVGVLNNTMPRLFKRLGELINEPE